MKAKFIGLLGAVHRKRIVQRTPCHGSHGLPIIGPVDADEVFKALAEPTRRTILDELAERDEQTLFEICNRLISKHGLSSSRQAISQHLDVLESVGLIGTGREGQCKCHSIEREPLRHLSDRWLEG